MPDINTVMTKNPRMCQARILSALPCFFLVSLMVSPMTSGMLKTNTSFIVDNDGKLGRIVLCRTSF